jgi:ribosomal protein S27E
MKIKRRRIKMSKVYVENEIKSKLLDLRNEHGFIDINSTIKFLLDTLAMSTNITDEQNVEGKVTIPAIVPKTTSRINLNMKEVTCPQCKHKFFTNIALSIKCPMCGLEGKT